MALVHQCISGHSQEISLTKAARHFGAWEQLSLGTWGKEQVVPHCQEPAAPSSLVHGESCVQSCAQSCAQSQSCVLSCALSHVLHCAHSPRVVTRCEQTGSAGVARPMASVTHSAPSPAALGDGIGEDMSLGPHGTRVTGSDMCQTLSPSRWPHAQLCQSFSDISCPGVYFKGM